MRRDLDLLRLGTGGPACQLSRRHPGGKDSLVLIESLGGARSLACLLEAALGEGHIGPREPGVRPERSQIGPIGLLSRLGGKLGGSGLGLE